jgi:predicted alpha/beta hydrolase
MLTTRQPQAKRIRAADGYELAACVHAADDARGTVLIVPAMGVRQAFYDTFAQWLAGQGFNAVTFDYRGMGQSRRGSLRGLKADLFDWARLDAAAMVDAAAAIAPALPLYWLGHSLGGQLLGMTPNHGRIARAITIASGSGYWRENAPALRRVVWWLWYVAAPLSLRVFGYFPGRRLRKVGDLPKGVMAQWRRWCLHPQYAVGVEGESLRASYAGVRTPITAISFADDEYMSARNVESLHGFYVSAQQRHERWSPGQLGVDRVGHFGFFRAQSQPLWQDLLLPALTRA